MSHDTQGQLETQLQDRVAIISVTVFLSTLPTKRLLK